MKERKKERERERETRIKKCAGSAIPHTFNPISPLRAFLMRLVIHGGLVIHIEGYCGTSGLPSHIAQPPGDLPKRDIAQQTVKHITPQRRARGK